MSKMFGVLSSYLAVAPVAGQGAVVAAVEAIEVLLAAAVAVD